MIMLAAHSAIFTGSISVLLVYTLKHKKVAVKINNMIDKTFSYFFIQNTPQHNSYHLGIPQIAWIAYHMCRFKHCEK